MAQERGYLLQDLNESQKAVVSAPRGNMLVIAGAGTGKTRVLVSRVVWLCEVEDLDPRNILCMTFTNKAAGEMRDRIAALVGPDKAKRLWAGTFHSVCLRMLRAYASQCGLSPDFSVLDSESQKTLCKRIMTDLTLKGQDFKDAKPAQVAARISLLKESGKRARDFEPRFYSELDKAVKIVYPLYEEACRRENVLDFAELLLKLCEVLEQNDALRDLQQRRFKEILVDEFQDTDTMQFRLLQLLAGPECHVMVVGDDDQSIYGWRGADYTNLPNFKERFKDVQLFKLEDNYRSGQNILDLANVLIGQNTKRLIEKKLTGTKGAGEKVHIIKCFDAEAEASFVARRIEEIEAKGGDLNDVAVLYRTNRQSLLIEQKLSAAHIDYTVFGGQKFFERAEILDALAYLRLLLNEQDDTAFLRIINVPARKLGPKVISSLRNAALRLRLPLFTAARFLSRAAAFKASRKTASASDPFSMDPRYQVLGPDDFKLGQKLTPFCDLMADLTLLRLEVAENKVSLGRLVKETVVLSGLKQHYAARDEKEYRKADEGRVQNLEELVSNAETFDRERILDFDADEKGDLLFSFLSGVTLLSSGETAPDGSTAAGQGSVRLMTLHSAKGLEFKTVFLVGVELNLLPSYMALNDGEDKLDEERRLAYVGITRAREELYLCYALQRMVYGGMERTGASVFLREIVLAYKETGRDKRPFEIVPA